MGFNFALSSIHGLNEQHIAGQTTVGSTNTTSVCNALKKPLNNQLEDTNTGLEWTCCHFHHIYNLITRYLCCNTGNKLTWHDNACSSKIGNCNQAHPPTRKRLVHLFYISYNSHCQPNLYPFNNLEEIEYEEQWSHWLIIKRKWDVILMSTNCSIQKTDANVLHNLLALRQQLNDCMWDDEHN